MHLIIPFAASPGWADQSALPALKLAHLQQLLRKLSPLPADCGDAMSLSPPHERALARALGLPTDDGLIPWAALQAHQRPELRQPGAAWAFITLCHWQLNSHHVAMGHLPLPDLGGAESDDLLAAMRGYFEEDGILLFPDQPGRWLAQGDVFAGLASAATDRVVGRSLEAWMPRSAQAAPLRRLQNEMQMLLYTHPVNDARAARGLPAVNSFWLSGTGALPVGYQMPDASCQPTVIDTLRQPALTQDWAVWQQAWQTRDASQIAPLRQVHRSGQPLQITLCGEQGSQSWHTRPLSAWQKVKHLFGSQPLSSLLGKL